MPESAPTALAVISARLGASNPNPDPTPAAAAGSLAENGPPAPGAPGPDEGSLPLSDGAPAPVPAGPEAEGAGPIDCVAAPRAPTPLGPRQAYGIRDGWTFADPKPLLSGRYCGSIKR